MYLKHFEYKQLIGTPNYWCVQGLSLGQANLLVGRNATGKSRTLNVISALADMLKGKRPPSEGAWRAEFIDGDKSIVYSLTTEGASVVSEVFSVAGQLLLDRSRGGKGQIRFEAENKTMTFQTPPEQVAALAKRDLIQHPYLELLHDWAESFRFYHFGGLFGKDRLVLIVKELKIDIDTSDENMTGPIFKKGIDTYVHGFKNDVIDDMRSVGYEIEDIDLRTTGPMLSGHVLPGDLRVLSVKERDIEGWVDQINMSAGMFRALSIVIHINFSLHAGTPSCIAVDDIGEGLDFERSVALIDIIMKRSSASRVQLIMATNDRFVMNKVPLEVWSILQRKGHECQVFNYENSRELFEEFKFTGLNNFDFFATDFINARPHDEEDGDIR
jgi:hypothetical protein